MGNMFLNLHSRQIKLSCEFPLLWWIYSMAKAHVKFNNGYKQERTVTVVLVTVARKAVLILFKLSDSITKLTLSVNLSTQHSFNNFAASDIYIGHVDEIMYKTLVTAYVVCILHCWLTRGLCHQWILSTLCWQPLTCFINHVLLKNWYEIN